MDYDSVKPWITSVKEYQPGKTIENCIKLASNENSYGPSPKVIDALKQNISNVYKYPYKDLALKQKIAEYCKFSEEGIVLGNGSDELIDMVFRVFNGPALGFQPSFSCYKIAANIYDAEYSEISLAEDFLFPFPAFFEAAKKSKLIFLCNPNNPTGALIDKKEITEILDLGITTVVDEAYFEFSGESAVPLLKDYDNLIVLRTFAKAFALAGLRMGYSVSNPPAARLLSKVKSPFNVNILAQEAALAALDDIKHMQKTVELITKDRELMYAEIKKKFTVYPSDSNFLLIDTRPLKSGEFYERMFEEGVIVRDFGNFNGFDGEYCRVSVGRKEENQRFLEALNRL